ncbi:hypothetical protein [Arthrobacter sp. UYCu712]|uniref:hypothetical protein n=1 Tax=Arthrobacter sp. UYCu712 TaxID=3156340 RepID=UPI0033976EFA
MELDKRGAELLFQWPAAPVFPQGHGPEHAQRTDLDWVAQELNDRPGKRLQKADRTDRKPPVAMTA